MCIRDRVLIPVQAQHFALKGVVSLFKSINQITRRIKPELEIDGIVLTLSLIHIFTTFLRQLTQGRGYYNFDFVRYETLPQMLESKVIEQAKALGNFADED